MSLMKTLAKVAIGVAVAKGVGKMVQGGSSRAGTPGRGTGGGGIFGDTYSPGQQTSGRQTSSGQGTGLEDLMGSILGGKAGGQSGNLGGLGGLIEGLAGGKAMGGSPNTGSFGDKLNQTFDRFGEPEVAPTAEQEDQAGVMLKAMIQAAKSDGKIDDAEKARLLENLGDVTREEMQFVQDELGAPVDINGLVRQIPRGAEQQVYLMSVMGIDLDNQKEAQYLHDLATAIGLGKSEVNAIHQNLGVPVLYS